jgi:hypothetical protein
VTTRIFRDAIDLKGASGATYRFMRARMDRPLSPMGGNFVYARGEGESCEIVFLGEAPNLMTGARALWERAVEEHGASELFTRLNVTERVRRHEQGDILSSFTPPMNLEAIGDVSHAR